MSGYTAGSVSAKIELNITDFKQAIKEVKKEVKSLNSWFKGANIESVANDVEKLKKELNGLKGTEKPIEKVSKETNQLANANENAQKTFKNLEDARKKSVSSAKTEQKTLDNTIKKTKEQIAVNKELEKSMKATEYSYSKYSREFIKAEYPLGYGKYEREFIRNIASRAYAHREQGRGWNEVFKNTIDYYLPVFSDYIDPLEPGNKKKYTKQTQKVMKELLDAMNVSLDPTQYVDSNGKKYKRVKWYGIGNIGSLDFSNFDYSLGEHPKGYAETLNEIAKANKRVVGGSTKDVELYGTTVERMRAGLDDIPYYKFDNLAESENKATKGIKQFLSEFAKADVGIKRTAQETENLIRKFANFGKGQSILPTRAILKGFSNVKIGLTQTEEQLNKTISKFAQFNINTDKLGKSIGLRALANQIKEVGASYNRFSETSDKIIAKLSSSIGYTERFKTKLGLLHTGFNELTNQVIRTTQVLNTFNFKLLDGVNKETIFYQRTVELASAMHRMNTQGTANWQGRSQFNYSSYVSSINQINQALTRQKQIQQSLKSQKLDQYYAKVNSATQKYWNQIRTCTVNLNSYKANVNQITKELDKQTQRTQRLTTAQYRLFQQYHTNNLNYYKANMNEINSKLDKQLKNTNNVTKGLNNYSRGTNQAAHSTRILSNTLYQIRGALLSLKMIFTAMGGMALWGFGMQLVEEVKNTVTAKNEMMAQLNLNNKVDASGIQYFTKSLNELSKEYQKVNKYSIGETVSSLGIEFNLGAEEMKKALPIVTMVQSEYIRAGRTSEEAALAVKDILQGEFQRLSRETGVGKEELKAFGWNGKKEDINSLLRAVDKAGKSRNWDVFAKKATSLNDVLTITKSRFSETGADLLDSATPAIVEAFNTIIGSIEGLSASFNKLNPFWQNIAVWGSGTSVIGGLLTALPMLTKGMGLVDIATIGWGKSIATAALNLNKLEVGQYGFRKALAATITGTKASEISTMRSSKAIFGRLLGLEATTLKEKGWLGAMVKNKASLKEGITLLDRNNAYTMSRTKKLAYLTTNIDLNTAKSLKQGEAIRKVATSWKLWRTAILGVTGIGIIAWFASVGMQADLVRKRIEAFNEITSSGSEKLKEAKNQLKTYTDQMNKYQKGTVKYDRAKANKEIMQGNVKDLETATRLTKSYKAQNKAREESITLAQRQFRVDALRNAGNDPAKATEKASGWTDKINAAQYEITRSYNQQYNWLYKSSQHINDRVKSLKAEGAEQEKINRYIGEYSTVSEEAGQHLKEFYQGNLQALGYFAFDYLKLLWIDLWNDSHFVKFWKSAQQIWESMTPTINSLKNEIIDVAHALMDFFSTSLGQTTLKVGLFGGAIALVVGKLGKWLSGSKSTLGALKSIGSSLVNRIREWRGYGKAKSEAEMPTTGKTSNGGINGGVKKGKFWETVGQDSRNIARNYAKVAVHLAGTMLIVTEAIVLMRLPMAALAEQGWQFKQWEPEIRKGIEGLKLMAPVLLAFFPPVIAVITIMGKFDKGISSSTIIKGAGKAALGIATGMLLVAESIALITPSIWALGYLGGEYQGMESQVKKGTEAMKTVADSLNYLAPFIPMIAIAVGSIALFFTGGGAIVGGIALASMAIGIPVGMLLVAETIWSLEYPLGQIAALGGKFDNIDEIKSGARAIELASEAMESVQKALANMVLIKWDLIANAITDLVGKNIGTDLTSLTKEDGFFDQLSTFTNEFNDKVKVAPINEDKITALSNVNTGLTNMGNVLKNTKTAIDNLPPEMKNQERTLSYDMETDKTTVKTEEKTNYFDQLKQPLQDLAAFVKEFNSNPVYDMGEGISQDKIDAVTSAANMIGQLNTAIQKVQSVMGTVNIQKSLNPTQGLLIPGGLGAILNIAGRLTNSGGTGSYVSSFGSSFQEMENILKDLSTFSNNVSGLGGSTEGSSPNVEGLASFVAAVSKNINDLKTTLSNSVPAIKSNATNIGKSVVSGIKDGLTGLNSIGSSIPSKLANGIMVNKEALYRTSNSLGMTSAKRFQEGVNIMSDYMYWELSYVKQAMIDRKSELGNTAYELGSHIASRFKEGDDINSPGIMARSMQDEVGYIGDALSGNNLPQMAYNLANSLGNNFNLDFGLSNIQLPNITDFTNKLSIIPSTVSNVKTQVSTNFNTMKSNINGAFTSILSRTRTNMGGMLSATTKNIGAIRTSWKGMQTALIQSAENIKTQTGTKINTLKTNLGNFWNKLKHPDQLIGSAGGHTGSIRRRSHTPRLKAYAGGTSSSYPSSKSDVSFIKEYLQCLATGSNCYAGGWNFNWNKNIQGKFNGWNTKFGKWNLDNFLKVGKFKDTNFPIKNLSQSARASIFKDYIFDVISGTSYSKYFNSKFGEDPVAALKAGAFNCWDGTNIILGAASAFGLNGSRGHGTWNGIGHVWANIPGIGVIDPTAIQQRGSFKSSAVKGYGAGSIRRGEARSKMDTGNTVNHNEEVHIHLHGDNYGIDELDKRIEQGARRVQRKLFTNKLSGV